MKLSDLRKLIKEELTNITEIPVEEVAHKLERDELGKFYVVTKPTGMKDENMIETNILEFAKKIKSGEIDEARIMGVYEKSGSAKTRAKELMKEIEDELKELQTTMGEYRSK
jgi:wyosine [tRNA(Phe)-imidazoG37] synthetase (radical SAM superfamily)